MKLLFKREQTYSAVFSLVPLRIGGGVTFSLHVNLELTKQEEALLKKSLIPFVPVRSTCCRSLVIF